MRSRTLWLVVFGGIVALGLGAAVVAAFVTDNGGPSASSTSTGSSSVSDTFDLPIGLQKDTLALAKHRRDLLVGLAAQPGGPVEVAAVHGDTPVASDAVRVSVDGRDVPTESCGTGCSRGTGRGAPGTAEPSDGQRRLGARFVSLPGSLPASGESPSTTRGGRWLRSTRTGSPNGSLRAAASCSRVSPFRRPTGSACGRTAASGR